MRREYPNVRGEYEDASDDNEDDSFDFVLVSLGKRFDDYTECGAYEYCEDAESSLRSRLPSTRRNIPEEEEEDSDDFMAQIVLVDVPAVLMKQLDEAHAAAAKLVRLEGTQEEAPLADLETVETEYLDDDSYSDYDDETFCREEDNLFAGLTIQPAGTGKETGNQNSNRVVGSGEIGNGKES